MRGEVRIELCGHEMTPLCEGALYWAAQKTLIVSDLHFEKGISFARSGQYLPPYDTRSTLSRVERLIADFRPERVISLGDSFHTPRAAEMMGEEVCASIRALTSALEWVWIEGNHDPDPPAHLGGIAAKEMKLGRLVFRHEPTGETGEISGHLHPCARIAGRGKRKVRRRCFVTNGQSLIMPAMGAFTGGLNVLDKAYDAPLGPVRQAIMMGEDRVYAVPMARLVPDRENGPVWRL